MQRPSAAGPLHDSGAKRPSIAAALQEALGHPRGSSAGLAQDAQLAGQPTVISHMNPEEDLSQEKAVWDQYRAWKRHIPKLYEHLTVHPLEWPTLTLDWIPEDDNRDEEGYTKNYLLIGTQAFQPPTQEEQQEALAAATSWEEKKPTQRAVRQRGAVGNNFIYNLRCYLPSAPEQGFAIADQFYRHAGKVEVQQRIPHEAGVVNVIRHMPQNPHIIATKGPARGATQQQAPVFVYNLDAAPDLHHARRQGQGMPQATPGAPQEGDDVNCPPMLYLFGHTQEGMTLSWNKRHKGLIASGSDDFRILVWDIEAYTDPQALAEFEQEAGTTGPRPKQHSSVTPLIELKAGSSGGGTAHEEAVQGVDWHPAHEHLLYSVGDDKSLRIWDTRVWDRGFVQCVRPAHNSNINCVQAHPFADHVVATCGCDGLTKIWDIRFTKRSRHNQIEPNMVLRAHSDEVTVLQWAPHSETVLATGSRDRTVIIWDIEKHGQKAFDSGTMECCAGFFTNFIPQEWRAPPKPRHDSDDLDIPPDVMFVHFGHTAPVTDISWNPSEDWMLASASEDNFLHIWQVADRVRSDEFDDPVISPAQQPMQEAMPMAAFGAQEGFAQEMQGQGQQEGFASGAADAAGGGGSQFTQFGATTAGSPAAEGASPSDLGKPAPPYVPGGPIPGRGSSAGQRGSQAGSTPSPSAELSKGFGGGVGGAGGPAAAGNSRAPAVREVASGDVLAGN